MVKREWYLNTQPNQTRVENLEVIRPGDVVHVPWEKKSKNVQGVGRWTIENAYNDHHGLNRGDISLGDKKEEDEEPVVVSTMPSRRTRVVKEEFVEVKKVDVIQIDDEEDEEIDEWCVMDTI